MKKVRLRELLFYALCCDFGIFAKSLISPVGNTITGFLKIPGGVGTSFSLLFLTAACIAFPHFGAGTLMGFVQSMIVLFLGKTGSMGALAPIGYILPGVVLDAVLWLLRRLKADTAVMAVVGNCAAAVTACLTANLLVFRLKGIVLMLYASVSMFTGALCGLLAYFVVKRLHPFLRG